MGEGTLSRELGTVEVIRLPASLYYGATMKGARRTLSRILTIAGAQIGGGHLPLAVASMGVLLGGMFWIFSGTALNLFELSALILLPVFVMPISAAIFPRDRETAFANVVLSYPISRAQYFGGNALAAFLAGFIYLLLTLPFIVLLVVYGGPAYSSRWGLFVVAGANVVVAAAGLGILISIMNPRQPTRSIFWAFGIGIVLAYAPNLLHAVTSAGNVGVVGWLATNILHVSPVVNAYDWLDLHANLRSESQLVGPILVMSAQTLISLAAAFVIFSRFQGSDDWYRTMRKRAPVLVVTFLLLLTPAFSSQVSYELYRGDEWINTDLGAAVSIPFVVIPEEEPLHIGSRLTVFANASLFVFGNDSVTFHDVELRLGGNLIRFDRNIWSLGDVTANPSQVVYVNVTTIAVVEGTTGLREGRAPIKATIASREASSTELHTVDVVVDDVPPIVLVFAILLASSPAVLYAARKLWRSLPESRD